MEAVYEKMKKRLGLESLELLRKLVIDKAKEVECESVRKTLYDLYGYLRHE